MAVSWAKSIAIAEPAPRPTHVARYLAPHWKGLLSLESEDGIGFVPAATAITLTAVALFGAGGGTFAALAVEVSGRPWLLWWWLGFDAFLAVCLATSYWLVGRYGLRFYDDDPADNALWRFVTVGGCAR
jgi:hypothetical protein